MAAIVRWGMVAMAMTLLASAALADEVPAPFAPEVPAFQLAQPTLGLADGLETSRSLYAGLADFALRLGEGGLFLGALGVEALAIVSSFGGAGQGSAAVYFVIPALLLQLAILTVGPLLNAVVMRAIADRPGVTHSFGTLTLASYLSALVVDLLTLGVALTGNVVGSLVAYLIGSAAASTAMGFVVNGIARDTATAEQLPPPPPQTEPGMPWLHGPAVPMSMAPGLSFAF